jgi:hypothetical protein
MAQPHDKKACRFKRKCVGCQTVTHLICSTAAATQANPAPTQPRGSRHHLDIVSSARDALLAMTVVQTSTGGRRAQKGQEQQLAIEVGRIAALSLHISPGAHINFFTPTPQGLL